MFARVIGTGYYVPEEILDNVFFESLNLYNPKTDKMDFKTSDEWIMKNMGVKERRIARDDEYSSNLGFEASKKALEDAGMEANDLEGIIFATVTPDRGFPSTACIIADKLNAKNLKNAPDIATACCGFAQALDIASMYIECRNFNNFLIVAADTITKIVDYENVNCPLFGDGAGAAIISKSEEPGIIASYSYCNATNGNCYSVYNGGNKYVEGKELIEKGGGFRKGTLRMPKGRQVMRNAIREMDMACEYLMKDLGWKREECFFIFHQANIRINKPIIRKLGLSEEQYIMNIDRYGNMSAACSAIAFAESREQGRIKKENKVIFSSFGSGEVCYGLGMIL